MLQVLRRRLIDHLIVHILPGAARRHSAIATRASPESTKIKGFDRFAG